jgi:hypothetical protein
MPSSTKPLTKLEELEQELCDEGIKVIEMPIPGIKAFVVRTAKSQVIAIDTDKIASTAEKRCIYLHELGHLRIPESMSDIDASIYANQRKEKMADREVIRDSIPYDKLKTLLQADKRPFEIAEILDVTESYVVKAINYYLLSYIPQEN